MQGAVGSNLVLHIIIGTSSSCLQCVSLKHPLRMLVQITCFDLKSEGHGLVGCSLWGSGLRHDGPYNVRGRAESMKVHSCSRIARAYTSTCGHPLVWQASVASVQSQPNENSRKAKRRNLAIHVTRSAEKVGPCFSALLHDFKLLPTVVYIFSCELQVLSCRLFALW
jgi:hypothetical protein